MSPRRDWASSVPQQNGHDEIFQQKSVPLLETRELCKDFSRFGHGATRIRAIDNVTLQVAPGEVLGIVGESGSGKTTLARLSLRLIAPTSGTVLFDGIDLAMLSPAKLRAKRREFQMIFQDPYAALNPSMTVEEILLEPLHVHKIGFPDNRKAYVSELLDMVTLSASFLKKKPADLSGGQQQRVGIARGLALRPRLLLADEPVSALDVSVQAQILNLLADLKRQHAFTLILISHSLFAVHYLCSRILVLLQGQIMEDAPSTQFFKRPNHPYSQALIDSLPGMDTCEEIHKYSRADDVLPRLNGESCCAFHSRCPHAFSICREQKPSLKTLRADERVACFLYS